MNILSINFHYITDEVFSYPGIVPIAIAEFENIVVKLLEEREPVSLSMLLNAISHGESLPEQGFLITFDDGLRCQWENAEPILKKYGIEAAYFVNTMQFVTHDILPVHKLHIVRTQFDSKTLLNESLACTGIDYQTSLAPLLNNTDQYRYDDEDSRALKYLVNFMLTPKDSTELINQLYKACKPIPLFDFYFSEEILKQVASEQKLGAHSHSHYPLGKMNLHDLNEDIRVNIEMLEKISQRKPVSISYPYGGKESVTKVVYETARHLGCLCGFSMERAVITSILNPLALPRFDVRDKFPRE